MAMKKYSILILLGILLATCKVKKPAQASSQSEVKKKSAEWYYEQGVIESRNTNSYVAIDNFTKAIKKKVGYYEAYKERADIYLSLDSIDSAIRDYDSLIVMKYVSSNQERLSQFYYLKANALYLGSQDSSACKFWKQARDLGHGNSWNQIRKYCK